MCEVKISLGVGRATDDESMSSVLGNVLVAVACCRALKLVTGAQRPAATCQRDAMLLCWQPDPNHGV
jgi:hypothetical protein